MNEMNLNDVKSLAFIGGGNMAAALIGGLERHGVSGEHIIVADPVPATLVRLEADHGIRSAADNIDAVADAQIVILAVKPQVLRGVAAQIAPHLTDDTLVISIAAGIPHAALSRWLGGRNTVVRCMPNQPALNGCGATALFAPSDAATQHRAEAQAIMGAVGITVWVEQESQLDTVTALSGSGPAYFFLLMEALEAAARDRGLPEDVAHELTVQTALGAAQMAKQSRDSLATLREHVTSRGGTTAAALAVFDAAGVRDIVAQALTAADLRSGELAAEFATF